MKEKLTQYGDYLQGVDRVQENNGIGFNRLDWGRWDSVRGNPEQMARILRKYSKQLSGVFGAEAQTVLNSFPTTPTAKFSAEGPYGNVSLIVNYLPSEIFNQYKDCCKKSGLWWDAPGRRWFVPGRNVAAFDFEKFSADLTSIGLEVCSFEKPTRPEPKNFTAIEAEQAIAARQGNIVSCRRLPNGVFSFSFSYSKILNDLFSNKTGQLSGITEYISPDVAAATGKTPHSRETRQLSLVLEALKKIRDLLPDWTIVTEGIDEAVKAQEVYANELQRPIPEVAEKLNPEITLFAFQNEGVRFIQRKNDALLGDAMGCGKTLQALAFVAGWNHRCLIVCPKIVRRNWLNEAKKFFPTYFTPENSFELVAANLKKHGLPNLSGAKITAVNYESLAKFLPAIQQAGFDTLIVDESHRIMNRNTQVCENIFAIKDLFRHKILLSGTAIKNKKWELFTQLEIVRPGLFASKQALKNATIGGTWNAIQECYLARSKEDVLQFLPSKITQILEVDVPGAPDYNPNVPLEIGEISQLKADVAISKAPATAEFVRELIDSSDDCVLVFSDSVEAAKKIHEDLGPDLSILHHGQLSDEKRVQEIARFNDPKTPQRVFVTTRQSLAVGANMTRANLVVFSDLCWTASDIRQAEDRTHRIGQTKSVNVYWMTAANNNWDHKVNDIIKRKYELGKKVTAGKQLTAEEREWMEKAVSIEDLKKALTGGRNET